MKVMAYDCYENPELDFVEYRDFEQVLEEYFKPENRRTVIEALVSIRREDLIGRGPDCLVEPDAQYTREHRAAPVKAQGRQRQRGKRPVQKPRRSNKAKRGR